MCGISVIIEGVEVVIKNKYINNAVVEKKSEEVCRLDSLRASLSKRGPDNFDFKKVQLGENICLTFCAGVLSLRGPFTPQPLEDEDGNLLLWNGEIFGGLKVDPEENDTKVLLGCLKGSSVETIIREMKRLEGPWGFIYWQSATNTLFFGRDVLGRRSLLLSKRDKCLIISSTPLEDESILENGEWIDLNTYGIYTISFNSDSSTLEIHPYDEYLQIIKKDNTNTTQSSSSSSSTTITPSPSITNPPPIDDEDDEASSFAEETQWGYFPLGQRIQLIPDSENINMEEFQRKMIEFHRVLSDAVQKRVTFISQPPLPKDIPLEDISLVGILFSGGLDSIVLAALTDQHVPLSCQIDLINVAFGDETHSFDSAPDRKTAINGYEELKKLNPLRKWNLVKVNVTNDELDYACHNIVYNLSYPSNTLMDITIAAALWFASRGEGILHPTDTMYRTPARVLLMGNGADEQLAGYGRHRTAFKVGGWQRLQNELDKDFNRIWIRNLGRDDRVVSYWGREARFPYLDENVVRWIKDCPLWIVTDLNQPIGVGDKQILREMASQILKLGPSTRLAKRAIQFGSRVSRQLNRNITAKALQKAGKNTFVRDPKIIK